MRFGQLARQDWAIFGYFPYRLFNIRGNSLEDYNIKIKFNTIVIDDVLGSSPLDVTRLFYAGSEGGKAGLAEIAHNDITVNSTTGVTTTLYVSSKCYGHHNKVRGNGVSRTTASAPLCSYNSIERSPFGFYNFRDSIIGNTIRGITETAIMIHLSQGTPEQYNTRTIKDNWIEAAPGYQAIVRNNASSRTVVTFSGNTIKPIFMRDTVNTMHYLDMTNNTLYVDDLENIHLPSARSQAGATWLGTRFISNQIPPVPLATAEQAPTSSNFASSVRAGHVFTFDALSITCVATEMDPVVYRIAGEGDTIVAWMRNTTNTPLWIGLAAV